MIFERIFLNFVRLRNNEQIKNEHSFLFHTIEGEGQYDIRVV